MEANTALFRFLEALRTSIPQIATDPHLPNGRDLTGMTSRPREFLSHLPQLLRKALEGGSFVTNDDAFRFCFCRMISQTATDNDN